MDEAQDQLMHAVEGGGDGDEDGERGYAATVPPL